ncbi:MAG: hypothetical protein Ct9H300mP1_31950 [Planctomycetaceae bacterium]|nr:MAG: hypothetical protein Ct9H300mP1_31950 [Planctomycetaceae bacterium]
MVVGLFDSGGPDPLAVGHDAPGTAATVSSSDDVSCQARHVGRPVVFRREPLTPGKRSGCSCIAAGASSGTLSSSRWYTSSSVITTGSVAERRGGGGQSGFQRFEKRARRIGAWGRIPGSSPLDRSHDSFDPLLDDAHSLVQFPPADRQRLARSSSIVSRRASTSLRGGQPGTVPASVRLEVFESLALKPRAVCRGFEPPVMDQDLKPLLVRGPARCRRHPGHDRQGFGMGPGCDGDRRRTGASSSLLRCTVAVTRHPITKSGRIMATVSRSADCPAGDPSGIPRARHATAGRWSDG